MNYFRAILKSGEKSERALSLTEQVISHNSGNYTAWHYRRLCLYALNKNLAQELKFINDMLPHSPKNYQIWYHRRAIVEKINDGSEELQAVEEVIFFSISVMLYKNGED